MTSEKARVFVLGLDGATFSLIRPWVQAGHLPAFKRVLEGGASAVLNSTFPPKTPSAWLSLITGLNPGQHGVFDFINYDIRSYGFYEKQMVKGGPRAEGRTLWDMIGQQGGKVAAVGVPMTYPVWPVNGVMIGENVLVDVEQQAYPLSGARAWASEYLSLPHFYRLMRSDPERFIEESLMLAERRLHILQEILHSDHFRFFMAVLDEPDRSHHCFWKYMADASSPLQDAILKHYRICDCALSLFLEHMDEHSTLFIISDHGGGAAADKYVNLNVALQQASLLQPRNTVVRSVSNSLLKKAVQSVKATFSQHEVMKLKGWVPGSIQRFLYGVSQNTNSIDWAHTSAYRFSMTPPAEGVMVNLAGRQPMGIVPKEDYERVRREVIGVLKEVSDPQTGKKIIKEAHLREEVFWGEHTQDAPDIIVLLEEGYKGGAGTDSLVTQVPESTLSFWNGDHRMEGIFVAYGNNIRPGTSLPPLSPEDFAPTALYAAGLQAPQTMHGRIATETFTPLYHPSLRSIVSPVASGPRLMLTPEQDRPVDLLSPKEEQALVERLKGLGYLE